MTSVSRDASRAQQVSCSQLAGRAARFRSSLARSRTVRDLIGADISASGGERWMRCTRACLLVACVDGVSRRVCLPCVASCSCRWAGLGAAAGVESVGAAAVCLPVCLVLRSARVASPKSRAAASASRHSHSGRGHARRTRHFEHIEELERGKKSSGRRRDIRRSCARCAGDRAADGCDDRRSCLTRLRLTFPQLGT